MPKEASFIIFNHISDYDPWVLYKIMRGRYSFVGKYALRKIPMVRCMASSIGTLYVDDHNPELNRKMVDNAVTYITEKDTSVALAPEGTRNTTGKIMPFKHKQSVHRFSRPTRTGNQFYQRTLQHLGGIIAHLAVNVWPGSNSVSLSALHQYRVLHNDNT